MKKSILTVILACLAVSAYADEGMWMINMLDKALERNMKARGLKLKANEIYNEEQGGVSDAVVSLAFGCTGSMISDEGLMITNHHCAYADIFALSTPEHNYLENGFWAMRRNEEIPVKSEGVYFLRKVLDVTQEVDQVVKENNIKLGGMAMRKISYIMEKKYEKLYPGKEVSLYSMYAGKEFYMMVYDKYTDVRLVAAPPVCIGAYGAEVDNWEWPQHKGDFAIYRIYTAPDGSPAAYSEDNVPMHPRRTLKVSTKGVKEGDYTMIMGYPGITNRYASSFEIDYLANNEYEIESRLKKERMEIINKWSNKCPVVRLKYSDDYFMLTNVQEIREGESMCFNKYDIPGIIAGSREKNIPASVLDSLQKKYRDIDAIERQIKYFQEAAVRSGKLFGLCSRVKRKGAENEVKKALDAMDMRVEKEIFFLNIKEIKENIVPRFWGDYLTDVFAKYPDPSECATALWNASELSRNPYEVKADDPVLKVYDSMKMINFNKEKTAIEGTPNLSAVRKSYKYAIYDYNKAHGIPQYPDANSSMRLTYGNVTDLHPADAVIRLSHSTATGIMEKYNPKDYIFSLKPELVDLYKAEDWGRWAAPDGKLWVNFLTTNDITGGNSGSPVMNAKGELVGLAFDGNKEGLAGDVYYDKVLNRCVCVDIRYVLWVLEKYAGMDGLVKEILD